MSSSFSHVGNCRRLVSSILHCNIYKNTCRSHHSLHHQIRSLIDVTAACSSGRWRDQHDVRDPGGRRYLHLPRPFKLRQDFRPIDRVPDTHEMVYLSPFHIYISYFYPTSMLMMSSSTLVAAHFYSSSIDFADGVLNGFQLFDDLLQVSVGATAMGWLTYLMWRVARRAPLRLYYCDTDDTFEAVFATLLPWKVSRLAFAAGDVRALYSSEEEDGGEDAAMASGTMAVFRGRYALGKRRLTLVSHGFRYPHFYNVMLGYVAGRSGYREEVEEAEEKESPKQ